jgi:hypothetical protein
MPNMNNARLIKDLQRFQEAAPKWIGYLQAQNSGVAAGATTTPGGTGSRNGRKQPAIPQASPEAVPGRAAAASRTHRRSSSKPLIPPFLRVNKKARSGISYPERASFFVQNNSRRRYTR